MSDKIIAVKNRDSGSVGYSLPDTGIHRNFEPGEIKKVPMAELEGLEFAYDNRKLVKELTFKVLETADNNKINNLIAFLHEKNPEYEIEVEIPFEHIEKYKN